MILSQSQKKYWRRHVISSNLDTDCYNSCKDDHDASKVHSKAVTHSDLLRNKIPGIIQRFCQSREYGMMTMSIARVRRQTHKRQYVHHQCRDTFYIAPAHYNHAGSLIW